MGKIESQSLLEAGWLELNALGLDETFKSLSQRPGDSFGSHLRHKPEQVSEQVQEQVPEHTRSGSLTRECPSCNPEALSPLFLSEKSNSEGAVTR